MHTIETQDVAMPSYRFRNHPVPMIATLLSALLAGIAFLAAAPSFAAAPAPFTRFPTASRDAIAFVAYGNLWMVPRTGGPAKRMTDDPGQVLMPHFSPDGRTIAFTWMREGGSDVYVMPAQGGAPRRLTHGPTLDSYDNVVTGWTPDGAKVLFLSLRQTPFHHYETYEVPLRGGLAVGLGLDHSGTSSLSPDGRRIAFDRTFRNLGGDRWKRYVGGQASDIFIQDLAGGNNLERITDWKGTDTAPMWVGHQLFFLSDRGSERRANLWVEDLDTKVVRQVTRFANFDVDMPSVGPGGIAFQQGGRLYLLGAASEKLRAIKVSLPADSRMAPRTVAATPYMRRNDIAGFPDYALGADGRTAYLVSRGDLMSVASDGRTRDLTRTPGAMEDHPAVSPDGRQLAFVTDAGGEQQLAIMPATGGPLYRTLTHSKAIVFYTPAWSPDGSRLLVADASKRLWLVRTDNGQMVRIAMDPFAELHDAVFSADAMWIAYSITRANQTRAIHIFSVSSGKDMVVTPPLESDRDPVFSGDGRHLFFISPRHEQPFVSDRDREGTIATIKSDGLYELSLPDTMSAVDLVDATGRATETPVDLRGGIATLAVRGTTLFYRATTASGIGGDLPGESSGLHAFDTIKRQDRLIVSDVGGYVLDPAGETALVRRGDGWHMIATGAGATADSKLVTTAAQITVEPHAENRAIVEEAWRLDRDMFWDQGMNGVDWAAIHTVYAHLAPMIGSHEDLLYLLGEMQGELSTSHMFLGGGDSGDPRPHVNAGLIGADLTLDVANGHYRFAHIYRGDPSRSRFQAPLGDPALDIRDGDYLMAIDGEKLVVTDDPYRLLLGKQRVVLTVARKPDEAGRAVGVTTTTEESEIRKLDWITRNRTMVDRLSGGTSGYVYLSDFDALGSEDFLRQYYPQTNKTGLVIDVRDNRGGFTSQWVLDVLRRPLAGRFRNREGAVSSLPGAIAPQALTVVTNLFSMSDGDQFPFFFRQWGMGKVVGQRTWGGVRGIKGPWRLMDGTFVTVPKDSLFAVDGSPIIENRGAEPDVIVDNTPTDYVAGRDRQLEAAVAALKPSGTKALVNFRRGPNN